MAIIDDTLPSPSGTATADVTKVRAEHTSLPDCDRAPHHHNAGLAQEAFAFSAHARTHRMSDQASNQESFGERETQAQCHHQASISNALKAGVNMPKKNILEALKSYSGTGLINRHPDTVRFVRTGIFDDILSFEDLDRRLIALGSNTESGSAFEVFVAALLATDPVYQIVALWPKQERTAPAEALNWLGLPATDCGVDGMLVDGNGRITTYQAKFRSRRHRLAYDDVRGFFDNGRNADHHLIISTATGLDAKGQSDAPDRTLSKIMGYDLDDLSAERMDEIVHWLRSDIHLPKQRHAPRKDQMTAVNAIATMLETADRTTYVAACGTGKTFTGQLAIEAMVPADQTACILVMVPSLGLVNQVVKDWARDQNWGRRYHFIAVCSARDVGSEDIDERPSDLPFPISSTNDDNLKAFLATDWHDQGAVKVVFATYQSSDVISAVTQSMDFVFDYGLADEAHRTVQATDSLFTRVLHDRYIRIAKRLFMTATPKKRRRRAGSVSDTDVTFISMEDASLYGSVAYHYSFRRARADGVICRPRLVIKIVYPAMIGANPGDSMVVINGIEVPVDLALSRVALARAIEESGATRVLTYHRLQKDAIDFTKDNAFGVRAHLPANWRAHAITSDMSLSQRAPILRELAARGETLIANCHCLSEGVNVPAIDMVFLASKRQSKIDIVQIIGRALRKPKGSKKEYGYVALPLLFNVPTEMPSDEALLQGGLDQIVDVFAAMMDEDDEIESLIEDGCTGQLFCSTGEQSNIVCEIIGDNRMTAALLAKIKDAIQIRIEERLRSSWSIGYDKLRALWREGRDVNVVQRYRTDDGFYLGQWLSERRNEWKNNRLSSERADALNKIGVDMQILDRNWHTGLRLLKELRSEGKDVNVARDYRAEDGFLLGQWVADRRKSWRSGRLSSERVTALNEVGVVMNTLEAKWQMGFIHLQSLRSKGKDVNVAQSYKTVDGFCLGQWLSERRKDWKCGSLPSERVNALKEIGVVLSALETKWQIGFNHLKKLSNEQKDVNVAQTYKTEDGFCLGQWLSERRKDWKSGSLSSERVTALNEIGVVMDILESKWLTGLQHLMKLKADGQDVNVSQNYQTDDSFQLGKWVSHNRANLKGGSLSVERVQALEEMGLVTDVLENNWQIAILHLKKIRDIGGNVNIAPSYKTVDGFRLGQWLSGRRVEWKKGRLSSDRVNALKELGVVPDVLETKWEVGLLQLKKHHDAGKDVNVDRRYKTEDGFYLGKWLSSRRIALKKGIFSSGRITTLENLGVIMIK